jgi:type VI secretion system protein ImpG
LPTRTPCCRSQLRSFQGYRLLQEYFAFPQRFRFADVQGLARAIGPLDTAELELVLLFGRGDPALENVVDAANFAPVLCAGCQPVREAGGPDSRR